MRTRAILLGAVWAMVGGVVVVAAPPTITITYPAGGFIYVGPTYVPARAEASDPDGPADIQRVEFYLNGTILVASVFSAPYECVLTNASGSTTSLVARVFDFAANSAAATSRFTVAATTTNHVTNTSAGYTPLPALGTNTYRGAQGGLYPGGLNEIPAAHAAAGAALANQIAPLDPAGNPSPTGKIVVISLGYSNTQQLFAKWIQLFNGVQASNVIFVNGAQGGQVASNWANASDPVWTNNIKTQLAASGVTTNQIQIAYDMHATFGNVWTTQAWSLASAYLQSNIESVARLQLVKFPKLKLTFWMTREYGGYAGGNLNPEPIAYETAFPIKWMIEKQITNDVTLNFNPSNGPVVAPWMAWGPYTWADGIAGRYDGLTYDSVDFSTADGVHPSDPSGRTKLAQQVLDHMQYSPFTRSWFSSNLVLRATNISGIAIATNGLALNFGSVQYLRYDIQTATDPTASWSTKAAVYGNGSNVIANIVATNASSVFRLEMKNAP